MNDSTSTEPRKRFSIADAFIWTGVVLFCIGLIAVIITFATPVFDVGLSTLFYLLALGAPLGLVFGVIGALLSGRRTREP